ncbi:MAG: glycosyltransferase [Halomonas sp.]|uniref:glycosyltransferase n=1 Tax=Halomonas sp. TaxID=1486246 RepID=UPI003F8DFA49
MFVKLAKWWQQGTSQIARPKPAGKQARANALAFDPEWYLAANPDVAASGMTPQEHYERHGKAEGRLPYRNQAIAWEHALWRGAHAVMVPRLKRLLEDPNANIHEQWEARWALARWYAWQAELAAVVNVLTPQGELIELDHPGPALLLIDVAIRLEHTGTTAGLVELALAQIQARFPAHPDTPLAQANALGVSPNASAARLAIINCHLQAHGLQPIALANPQKPLHLDNITRRPSTAHYSPLTPNRSPFTPNHSPLTIHHSPPLISVIIPLYNAAHTLATALESLFDQQSVRLEIIVVDDASQDDSAGVVEQCQANAPAHVSLRLIRHVFNQGAYAARNTGLAVANGAFITTHDSDDWSHPQKLALQCQALLDDAQAKACLSYWVRVTPEMLFHRWRLDEYGWAYPNISSLMFRREVRDTLGYWDNVSVNADSEYRLRIEAAYGVGSLQEVLPGIPLAFGRADEGSLSQHARSHLAGQFAGMRFHYMQAARSWHQQAARLEDLYMPVAPEHRRFTAPPAMLRSTAPINNQSTDFERVIASGLFDAGWYLERYIDLQQVKIEPLCHFWESGGWEGRDPGPGFSTSGYLRGHPEALGASRHPLAHYLAQANPQAEQVLPVWPGALAFEGRPTVMLCGHQAGATLFGAERSLLDVLDALGALRFNVIVTLPEANNATYEQALLRRCKALAVLPYGWWQTGRLANDATVAHFQTLIARYSVQAVHGNTVVLHEPYVAARREKIPTLVHVRELPAHDSALCDLLGATADEVVAHVHRHADVVIANSRCVARAFAQKSATGEKASPISVVPNTIEIAPLLALPEALREPDARVRVGMLSSNVAKKGLADVEAMAAHLQTLAPAVEVVLYGPLTPAIHSLQQRQAQGQAPANITYAGYVNRPAEALAELDVVVNLSRFQESFGRTVLEAMAAARPVVAYDWGALNELVIHGKTGYLVPYATPLQAAKQVARLAGAPARCCRLGRTGRKRAEHHFGTHELCRSLAQAYQLTQVPEFTNTFKNG